MHEHSPAQSQFSRTRVSHAGFTLIEVVSSLAIMTVLMLGLSGALMISASAIPDTNEYGQADQQVHLGMAQVEDDLRLASSILLVGTSGTDQTLTLTMESLGVLGESSSVKYSYNKSAGTLSRKADTEAEEVVLSNINASTISTVLDGTNIRQVYILLDVKGTKQQLFERHVVLPNKPGVG